ncbi:MAG: ATP synthase subunit I [Saprospiraceae bacterium]
MENDFTTWMLTLLTGILLGIFFFGGLWWTIHKGLTSKYAGLWFLGSMLVRTGVVLTGFYFVSGGQWERIVVCLAGFIIARLVVLRIKRPWAESKIIE